MDPEIFQSARDFSELSPPSTHITTSKHLKTVKTFIRCIIFRIM